MDTKLTLKLDKEVIERAKAYAAHQGVSLSGLVENYLALLTRREAEKEPRRLTGVVAELAGVLSGIQIEDPKEAYTEYLLKKYS
jgi:Family of unknown function (DUF6364)